MQPNCLTYWFSNLQTLGERSINKIKQKEFHGKSLDNQTFLKRSRNQSNIDRMFWGPKPVSWVYTEFIFSNIIARI